MIDFLKITIIPLSDSLIGVHTLLTYNTANVAAMMTNNPDNLFTERIAATMAAANALEDGISSELDKGALQIMRTQLKEAFRATLPDQIGRLYAAVGAKYGLKSAELTRVFPQGRSIFTQCKQESLNNYLEQLAAGIAAYAQALGADVVTQANNLVTTWDSLYQESSQSKRAKKGVAVSRQALRAALEVELWKNVLWVAYNFPGDEAKMKLYCPQELLRARTAAGTPGPATLALQSYDAPTHVATFTLSADGATIFRMYRRLAGEADLTQVSGDIPAVEGAATFSIHLEGTAAYEFAAEGVNGTRGGERSDIVTVAQS